MKINPVLSHGLRSRMRGVRAMILMVIYLAITLAIFLLVYQALFGQRAMEQVYYVGYSPYGNTSNNNGLFAALTLIQFALIAMVVPAMNAGSIAGERERQTLDLLLCSRLSAIRIIIGKLWSNVIFVAFLIALTTPFFAVVYICGGLTLIDVAKILLFFMACAYACASIATLFSSLFKKTALATICTYIVLVLFVVLTLVIGSMQSAAQYEAAMMQYNPALGISAPQMSPVLLLRMNPIMVLMESIPGMNILDRLPFYSMNGMGMSMGMGTTTPSLWYAVVLYLGISIVCNIISAIAIKPVKKLKLR